MRDIKNERFAMLVAIKLAPSETKHRKWLFACDCGKQTILRADHVLSGATKSCGCLRVEMTRKNKTIHGHARVGKVSLEFRSWWSAVDRTTNPKNKRWNRYGGRGIIMCQQWRDSFECFLAHMGPKPKGMTLDRIDNNGNYEPGNCRWATYVQQNNNRSDNIASRKT